MIKDVIAFDVDTALSFVKNRIRKIVTNDERNKPLLLDFAKEVRSSGILDTCDKFHKLSDTETKLRDYIVKTASRTAKMTPAEYDEGIIELQKMSMEALATGGLWLPVTYTILSVTLYCCFSDLRVQYPDERDRHINHYSACQVIKSLQYSLQEITGKHEAVMSPLIKEEVKTGYDTVVEEYIFMKKYYYIDLNGKKYSNYNSAAKRDEGVDKYVSNTYAAYEKNPNGMIGTANIIISQYLKDFNAIAAES